MKTITKGILLFVILMISFSSCTVDIEDMELENAQNRLVVEGSFTNEWKQHSVKLTRSSGYLSGDTSFLVEDATVFIKEGKNEFPLTHSKGGVYLSSFMKGEVGKEYALHIVADGVEYIASEKMSVVPAINLVLPIREGDADVKERGPGERVSYDKPIDQLTFSDTTHLHLTIFTSEPEGKGDYYYWHIFVDDCLVSDTLGKTFFVDDEFVDGMDTLVFEYDERHQFDFIRADIGAIVKVETRAISKGYYDFIFGSLLETQFAGSPFGGAPANVPSNFTNGAVGYFSVEAVASFPFVVRE